jgi:hypothetical protein
MFTYDQRKTHGRLYSFCERQGLLKSDPLLKRLPFLSCYY